MRIDGFDLKDRMVGSRRRGGKQVLRAEVGRRRSRWLVERLHRVPHPCPGPPGTKSSAEEEKMGTSRGRDDQLDSGVLVVVERDEDRRQEYARGRRDH